MVGSIGFWTDNGGRSIGSEAGNLSESPTIIRRTDIAMENEHPQFYVGNDIFKWSIVHFYLGLPECSNHETMAL